MDYYETQKRLARASALMAEIETQKRLEALDQINLANARQQKELAEELAQKEAIRRRTAERMVRAEAILQAETNSRIARAKEINQGR